MWSFFNRDPSKDFPYEITDLVAGTDEYMFWKLHKGKKKANGEPISVFVSDVKSGASETQLELARAAVKRLKTLRHPNVLMYVDSLETDKCVYLATEAVEPLQQHLAEFVTNSQKKKQQKNLSIAWGLFQVTRALAFLNNDGNLQHNAVSTGSIFVNSAGEWKLGGLEYTAAPTLQNPLPIKIMPGLEKYDPPEKTDRSKLRHATKWSVDMWGLGTLIWESFNGPMSSPASLKSINSIPKQLTPVYCELVGANPGARPNPKDVVDRCRQPGGYFHNDLVESLLFLEEMQIKEATEKTAFFSKLPGLLDGFPDNLSKHKILPQLINAFEFGNAGSAVLGPMFKLGNLLSEDEYQKRIVPCVVKLFSSPDRATRARLLQQLEHFAKHLHASTVNDQIFPQIANGFVDSNPTIREQTVKSILYLAPKLNYNNLNVEVLKHFARLQSRDEEGGIRTNTTVCLGKVAVHLHPETRQKVLVSAFTRALRDPFAASRKAGILALAATHQFYTLAQTCQAVMPALAPLTCDPERDVRDQAFKVFKSFLAKLEKVSEDPSLKESMEADVNANASPNVSDVASTWAGWAVSAVTSKFHKTQIGAEKAPASAAPAGSSAPASASAASAGSAPAPAAAAKAKSSPDSDSESNWDSTNWGSMTEERPAATAASGGVSGGGVEASNDGWDVDEDEWAPLDAAPVLKPTPASTKDDFTPVADDAGLKSIASFQWDAAAAPSKTASDSQWATSVAKEAPSASWETNWDGTSQWQAADGAAEKDEARKRREEKRVQRQKEIEAKRSARQGGVGAMKLGARKVAAD